MMARRGGHGLRRRSADRRRSGRGGNKAGWAAIVVCAALAISVGLFAHNRISKGRIDEATLCHVNGVRNVTAILLDLTDPLSATQHRRLTTIMDGELDDSAVDTMISLGVVSEDPANWGARFAKCKPATGEEANALYENPTIVGQRHEREFMEPFRRTLHSMLAGEAENRSPIMEALQSLISETPDFTSAQGQRKIVMVSDMLQHSRNLSFYRKQGWDHFVGENGIRRLAGNLDDVSVEILRIPRFGKNIPSNEIVETFWTRYFDRQGSRPPSVKSLGDL